MILFLFIAIFIINTDLSAQDINAFQIGRVKYGGGGDWYNDPSAEVNLLKFTASLTNIKVRDEYVFTDVASDDIYKYPLLFITGHGNISLSNEEARRLRKYCEEGGFIFIDDDYGMDNSIRREMKKVFPERGFVEIPFSHGIYSSYFLFRNGPPKTHEHDDKAPRGYGIFLGERLVVYYTYESNPSDGWADARSHNDSPLVREEALKFGANILIWALTN
ncbi:MAG: DUF4159 domain-containing protein [Ignavibacteriales bacterium]|nr:DUF4159 domain-containing protein [Ignavibacteriales bacterium]MCF8305507.1 DUF4159 domain-containing protein [Ignavibacteriales bacterium]MCF8315229.1 DUF4159 domain-containing protein [Ignavibacteriales bacterium]MCF8436879.1 DUF4159 domain-containing protein [Ignavibacteriales bacterium]